MKRPAVSAFILLSLPLNLWPAPALEFFCLWWEPTVFFYCFHSCLGFRRLDTLLPKSQDVIWASWADKMLAGWRELKGQHSRPKETETDPLWELRGWEGKSPSYLGPYLLILCLLFRFYGVENLLALFLLAHPNGEGLHYNISFEAFFPSHFAFRLLMNMPLRDYGGVWKQRITLVFAWSAWPQKGPIELLLLWLFIWMNISKICQPLIQPIIY